MELDIQVENGNYTRIHNEILEMLAKTRLAPLEFALLIVIFRKTYGYQKKNDVISISQFCESTGANRIGVIKALNNLVRLKIIYREPAGQMYSYGFNKYYDQWLPETYISRRAGQTKNFGDKCKSTKRQTSIPMENSQSTYGEPVYLWSTGIPMENITGILVENQTSIPMENTQKKYLKEIKKYSSVPEKSLERKPQNKESKEFTEQKQERQKMFDLLVSICKIDPNIKRGHLNKTIKILMDSGYTSYDLEKFSDWWNKNDWRGVKGQPPTLGQVAEFIFRVKEIPPDEENEELEAYITPEGERRFRRKGTNGNS